MRKIVGCFFLVGTLVLMGWTLAVEFGWLEPGQDHLGAQALVAMDEYRTFVAVVQEPGDIPATRERELQLREKALLATTRYLSGVTSSTPRKTWRRVLDASAQFEAECKRYEALASRRR